MKILGKRQRYITTRITGVRTVQRYLSGVARRSNSFSAQFRWARRELAQWNAQNFATLGSASGKAWNALDTEYQAWKIINYGSAPTMVRTGDLYRDLVTLRGGPNHVGHKTASFGTDLEYAKFHQMGTRFMPARKIVFEPVDFQEELGNRILEHLIYGPKGTHMYKKVKSIFNRTRTMRDLAKP